MSGMTQFNMFPVEGPRSGQLCESYHYHRRERARHLNRSMESTDSTRAAHSPDTLVTLPVESGLPMQF